VIRKDASESRDESVGINKSVSAGVDVDESLGMCMNVDTGVGSVRVGTGVSVGRWLTRCWQGSLAAGGCRQRCECECRRRHGPKRERERG
jgi:hypothetical protein